MTHPTERRARRPFVALAVVVTVLAGLFAGRALLSGVDGSPADPLAAGSPPSATSLGADPASPPSPAPSISAGPVVAVPARIDATAGTDVAAALQAVLDSAPNGATIRFPAGARYLLGSTLHLDARHDLVLDGRGASLRATAGSGAARPVIRLSGSSGVTIRDLVLIGANPQPGVYRPTREHDHGVSIVGSAAITLAGLRIEATSGDCVYIADQDGAWSDGVSLLDSTCHGPGRNGVGVVGARNIDVERTAFSNVGYHVLDLEPNQGPPLEGASNVTFRANTVSAPVAGFVIAANGWGPVDRVTVSDNVLAGLALRITVAPAAGSGFRRSAIEIRANRSDTIADQADPLMQFESTDDLTITGNVQPLAKTTVLAGITNSCRVTVSGNELGLGQPALISGPSC
jgi:polygalacturonase